MYEHDDLVHESFPKPASEATPSYTVAENLPMIKSPSIKPGPYDAVNADKRWEVEKLEKLRRIIKE